MFRYNWDDLVFLKRLLIGKMLEPLSDNIVMVEIDPMIVLSSEWVLN